MPKLGMEPVRRRDLINATIREIGDAGTLDITVAQIARRAGMSSALAHHYFGGKDDIFLAAMRHVLRAFGAEARAAMRGQTAPMARAEAIIDVCFGGENFRADVISAWLNFYVLAQRSPEARRLLVAYQSRLRSNLRYALRPILGAAAEEVADMLAAMIDGAYLRHGLGGAAPDGARAAASVKSSLTHIVKGLAS